MENITPPEAELSNQTMEPTEGSPVVSPNPEPVTKIPRPKGNGNGILSHIQDRYNPNKPSHSE